MKFTEKRSNYSPFILVFMAGVGFCGLGLASLQQITNRQEKNFCSESVGSMGRVLIESRSAVGTVRQCFPTPRIISQFEFNYDQ
jgi:hypothetical protein